MAGRFSGPRRSSLTAAVRKGSSPSSSSIFGELCSRLLRFIQRANEIDQSSWIKSIAQCLPVLRLVMDL